jgi:hypothetical protein
VVAEGLRDALQEKLATVLTSLSSFKGSVLEGVTYRHPLAHQVSYPPAKPISSIQEVQGIL